jgi:hypothetical protein
VQFGVVAGKEFDEKALAGAFENNRFEHIKVLKRPAAATP